MGTKEEKRQFEHLVLLIGTNPLPNYIVAKYFLNKNTNLRTITAIHSPDTYKIAYRLRMVLKNEMREQTPARDFDFKYCGLEDAGNAEAIREDIHAKIELKKNDTFHLNYTGGTKNMSVQSYVVLYTDFADEANLDAGTVSFSYLDARTFKLLFDDGSSVPIEVEKDLRDEVSITFENLLSLHHCDKLKDSTYENWKNANKIMQEFIDKDLIHKFVNWKTNVIRQIFYKGDNLKKPGQVLLSELEAHAFWQHAKRVIDAFPPACKWHFEDGVLHIPDSSGDYSDSKGPISKGVRYLDGDWLEYYMIDLIESERTAAFKFESNWRIIRHQAEKDFEIDCLLLRGYQFCGISITTAFGRRSEALCKSKAFEILHRSQQMGGDESRAVLMTIQPEPKAKKIERDLKIDTGLGEQDMLMVLSLDDLKEKSVWQRITEHMLS